MQRTKWFDRRFFPIEDNGLLPSIIQRLAGTPARVEEIVNGLSDETLKLKPENKWSIKEEIGHLADLEPLGLGRIDDLTSKAAELRAADLTNQKTHNANYNAADISLLTKSFRQQRQQFVDKFRNLTDEQLLHSAQHPRLKTPMRVIDLAFFVAEHDDHHLAAIHELIIQNRK